VRVYICGVSRLIRLASVDARHLLPQGEKGRPLLRSDFLRSFLKPNFLPAPRREVHCSIRKQRTRPKSEPSPSALINSVPKENNHGTKILEEGIRLGQARDEEAQIRHVEERPLGQKGEEPQAGDRDRIVGGEGLRAEGPEEAVQQALQEERAEIPQVVK